MNITGDKQECMAAILCVWIGQKLKFDTTPPWYQDTPIHGNPSIDRQDGKEATEPIRFLLGTILTTEIDSEIGD